MNYLEYIKKRSGDIRNQGENYVPFENIYSPKFDDIKNETFQSILKEYKEKGRVSRADIFKRVSTGKLYEAFMLIILWGNLGAFSIRNVKLATSKEDEVKTKLNNVKELIKKRNNGDFSAFTSMMPGGENHIAGIGISFFTKVLYFFDNPKDHDSYLIFDKWSQCEHCAMIISSGEDDYKNKYKLKPKRRSVDISIVGDSLSLYKDYIKRISYLSQTDELRVDSGKLEEFLFGYSGNYDKDNPRKYLIDFLKSEYNKEHSDLINNPRQDNTKKTIKEEQMAIQEHEPINVQANTSAFSPIGEADIRDINHDDFIIGYSFFSDKAPFILFVAYKHGPTGYFCELRHGPDPSVDIADFEFVRNIITKYDPPRWEHRRGNPNPNFKYVAFGEGATSRKDALDLMRNILKDIKAPDKIINSIPQE